MFACEKFNSVRIFFQSLTEKILLPTIIKLFADQSELSALPAECY